MVAKAAALRRVSLQSRLFIVLKGGYEMEQSVLKSYVKYVSLNILGMIGLSCYILADTFFISRALGAVGLAALNFSIGVYRVELPGTAF